MLAVLCHPYNPQGHFFCSDCCQHRICSCCDILPLYLLPGLQRCVVLTCAILLPAYHSVVYSLALLKKPDNIPPPRGRDCCFVLAQSCAKVRIHPSLQHNRKHVTVPSQVQRCHLFVEPVLWLNWIPMSHGVPILCHI